MNPELANLEAGPTMNGHHFFTDGEVPDEIAPDEIAHEDVLSAAESDTRSYREASVHLMSLLDRILTHIVAAHSPRSAALAVAWAMGRSGIVGGKSQEEIAWQCGVTKQAFGKAVIVAQSSIGIPPLPSQRPIESRRAMANSRRDQLKP